MVEAEDLEGAAALSKLLSWQASKSRGLLEALTLEEADGAPHSWDVAAVALQPRASDTRVVVQLLQMREGGIAGRCALVRGETVAMFTKGFNQ